MGWVMMIFFIPIFTAVSVSTLVSSQERCPVAKMQLFSLIAFNTLTVSVVSLPLSFSILIPLTSLDNLDSKPLPTHSGGISYLLRFRKFSALIVGNQTMIGVEANVAEE